MNGDLAGCQVGSISQGSRRAAKEGAVKRRVAPRQVSHPAGAPSQSDQRGCPGLRVPNLLRVGGPGTEQGIATRHEYSPAVSRVTRVRRRACKVSVVAERE